MSIIGNLHEKLASKKISSVELTKIYLDRAKKDKTNSFITVCEESALKEAAEIDAKGVTKGDSPLKGVPIALKDNMTTMNAPTTCASKLLGEYKAPYDADVTRRLKNDGSIMIGKLNMDEFAMGGSNENSAFGVVRNPVNLDYVPGGSSGGSAAAAKAGLAAATLGSDTGGSIRLPASYTGLVGMKPTYGSVSRYGLVAFASSLDQIGPMTQTVDDCAIMLSSIAGRKKGEWEQDSTLSSHPQVDYLAEIAKLKDRKYRIGVPKEYFISGMQPEVEKSTQTVIEALKKAGHTLVDISLPHTQYSVAVYYIVAVSEASSNLSRFDGVRFGNRVQSANLTEMYKKTIALFGSEVKRRIVLGTFALSSGYYDAYFKKACQVRRLIANDFKKAFESCDLIVGPVAPTTAFKLGEKVSDPLKMYLNDILTIPVNLAGLPAISVPAGRDSKGMPIGVQFIGKHFQDAHVLNAARFVEQNVYHEEVSHVL